MRTRKPQTLRKADSEVAKPDKPVDTRMENGFCVFDVPRDNPPITSEHVNRVESDYE